MRMGVLNWLILQATRAYLPLWLLVIFAGHAALYLALGTRTWLSTALLATAVYGVVLWALRAMGARERLK